MEQPQYNLFHREKIEKEYRMIYETVGLGTTIWSPLASGLLTGKYNDGIPKKSRLALKDMDWLKDQWLGKENLKKVERLGKLANQLDISTARLSIAWCVKNTNVTTAILGATKKTQLKENLKAIEDMEKLTPEVMEKIDEIMNNKPVQPLF
jgi:aryl-alcohol dehydrogenase-like predicted oxidoreductase